MLKKILGTLFVFALMVLAGVALIGNRDVKTLGSVTVGNEYHSTTTNSTWETNNMKMLTSCTNALGSVVITNATAGSILELRDATSTTDISSTTIATISSTATAGTYTFDVSLLRNGLAVLATVGNVSSTTVTCR